MLVVRSKHVVSLDTTRQESYWVDEIDCVEIPKDRCGDPFEDMEFEPEKIKHFYFGGGCMKGRGKLIKDSDVKVVGTTTLIEHATTTTEVAGASKRIKDVTTTYQVNKLKRY